MSEELFVRCCAPTLAGIKTGSMFTCEYASQEELRQDIRRLNRELAPRGLRILPLRYHNRKALLYVFRPAALKRDMNDLQAQQILREAGYDGMCCEQCVRHLMKRMQKGEDFPHEVGLFLSYPPEDVCGFIRNHAQNYKFIGYWKVYGDEENARRTFSRYKKCTDSYCRSLKAGCRLTDLAVAI